MADYLSVQIKTDTLVRLIEQGVLSGADLHCSEVATKALIQEVCLKACIKKICHQCDQHEACAQKVEQGDKARIREQEVFSRYDVPFPNTRRLK